MADLTIVGAGPAGLAAAVSAAEAGATVTLIDEAAIAGGQIWRHDCTTRELPPRKRAWLERVEALGSRLTRLARHSVIDASPSPSGGARLVLHDLDQPAAPPLELDAPALILACGARERLLPFPGWTLPGIMGVGGLQALAKQGLELEGKRIVLAGSGPLLLAVAADLRARGAELVALVEQAPRRAVLGLGAAVMAQRSKRTQAAGLAASLARVRRLWSSWPTSAQGERQVEALTVRDDKGRVHRLECDLLGCGFGLVPELRLARLLGCAVQAEGGLAVDRHQRTSLPAVFAVGEQCGIAGIDVALLEGPIAARAALALDPIPGELAALDKERAFASRLARAYALRPELAHLAQPQTLVCRCEDVALAALRPWPDARSAKLHTRCGMGSCQGRVCEPALEFLLGWQPSRCRPPLIPLPLSALRGPPRDEHDAVSRRDASHHHPL